MIERVCVFCGSSAGNRPIYIETAYALGQELARLGIGLVYGGGRTGLMGAAADGTLSEGGHVIGIMPRNLSEREIQHTGVQELHVVETMHERKAMMAQKSDAFVALPGGFGTYEELFEVITWAQLGIHAKPILILNTEGYFDPLLQMVQYGTDEGFIRTNDPDLVRVAHQVGEVVPLLQAEPQTPPRPKWLDLKQS